jgi:hypothetical protein
MAAPAARLSTVTMSREAITVGFDAGGGFLGRTRGLDIARFRCAGRRFVSITHPDYVDHLLHRGRLKYVKCNDYEPIRAAAGINLLTDEGESWAGPPRHAEPHVRAPAPQRDRRFDDRPDRTGHRRPRRRAGIRHARDDGRGHAAGRRERAVQPGLRPLSAQREGSHHPRPASHRAAGQDRSVGADAAARLRHVGLVHVFGCAAATTAARRPKDRSGAGCGGQWRAR